MTRLLSDYIKDLHLDPNAPYPWQVLRDKEKAKSLREEIKAWRHEQRLHLARPDDAVRDRDSDSTDDYPDDGGVA